MFFDIVLYIKTYTEKITKALDVVEQEVGLLARQKWERSGVRG